MASQHGAWCLPRVPRAGLRQNGPWLGPDVVTAAWTDHLFQKADCGTLAYAVREFALGRERWDAVPFPTAQGNGEHGEEEQSKVFGRQPSSDTKWREEDIDAEERKRKCPQKLQLQWIKSYEFELCK